MSVSVSLCRQYVPSSTEEAFVVLYSGECRTARNLRAIIRYFSLLASDDSSRWVIEVNHYRKKVPVKTLLSIETIYSQ